MSRIASLTDALPLPLTEAAEVPVVALLDTCGKDDVELAELVDVSEASIEASEGLRLDVAVTVMSLSGCSRRDKQMPCLQDLNASAPNTE
jgi:hypothetical protein